MSVQEKACDDEPVRLPGRFGAGFGVVTYPAQVGSRRAVGGSRPGDLPRRNNIWMCWPAGIWAEAV